MIFLTSDWHINHRNILKYGRGKDFDTVEQMNETLIRRTNDLVSSDDELWFIGDIVMGERAKSLEWVKQIECRNLYLVLGNHDSCAIEFDERAERFIPLYEDAGLTIMGIEERLTDVGSEFKLCHFPYRHLDREGDNRYDEYAQYYPDYEPGVTLLHGHTHSSKRVSEMLTTGEVTAIHVGVDAWGYRPVSLDEIIKLERKQWSLN